jgi:ABC-type branched-subunit amino acid transport system ATPase component
MRAYGGLAMNDGTAGVAPGEIAGVIGLKGAGKTMLLNRIAGSKPPAPVRVRFDREEVTGRPALGSGARGSARETVGFGIACTFQIPALVPFMIASQNVRVATGRARSVGWWHAVLGLALAEGGSRERGERRGSGSTDLVARRPRGSTSF